MFQKLILFKKIIGNKIFFASVANFFLSIIAGLFEIIGIGLLAIFAISLSDTQIILSKIPLTDLKLYLASIEKYSLILLVASAIIFAFILKHCITFLIFYFEIKILKRLTLKIKQQIFLSYLKEKYEYFLNNNKSEFINIISSQVGSFLTYIYNIFSIIKESILVLIIFLSMLFINWKIVLAITIFLIILTFTFSKRFKQKLNSIGDRSRILEEQEIKHLNESYESIKFIKLGNKNNFFLDILTKINSKKNRYEIIHFLIGKLPKIYLEILVISSFMLLVLYLLKTYENTSSIFGLITFLAFSVIRIMPSFIVINNSYTNLSFFKSPFENVLNKTSKIISIKNNNKTANSNIKLEKISFNNVDFNFSGSKKNILKNLNFSLNLGDKLGIIGASGSGKSTILNNISGLLSPSKGQIYFNDQNINTNPEILVDKVSYVSQDCYLLDTNIKKNIAFAIKDEDIDNDKIKRIIEICNLSEFVNDLPNGLETIVGDKGSKISHGQRQRIGIARALYVNTEILMLDESLNALDYQNEEVILKNIFKIHDKKFLILVSHRLESLKLCNKLMVLENGNIRDFGEKNEILNRNVNLQKYFEKDETS